MLYNIFNRIVQCYNKVVQPCTLSSIFTNLDVMFLGVCTNILNFFCNCTTFCIDCVTLIFVLHSFVINIVHFLQGLQQWLVERTHATALPIPLIPSKEAMC